MIYEIADIVRDIKIALDENTSSTQLVAMGDVDTLTLNDIIDSKVEDAARYVVLHAPAVMLDSGKAFGGIITWDMTEGYGSGTIALPDDFLRLIVFQMSDWSMPVTQAIDANHPLYSRQHSRYAGVRGNPQRPVVAVVQYGVGNVLEFYTCEQGTGVYVKLARYAPKPERYTFNNAEVIDLPEKLLRPLVYYAAYLVAVIQQQTEQADRYKAICHELLGITMTNE